MSLSIKYDGVKGIVVSHEDGGAYVMDCKGEFHFRKEYRDLPVGTEITIREKPKVIYLQIVSLAACLILMVASGIFGRTVPQNTVVIEDDAPPLAESVDDTDINYWLYLGPAALVAIGLPLIRKLRK